MIELTFLGTSAGVPTRHRNVSGLALRPEQSGGWLLFDCGEATQHQIMKSTLSLFRLERIFITHLHGDHVYGLFGLLASRGMLMCETPLEIYGPPGLKEMLESVMRLSQLHLPFEVKTRELNGTERLEFGSYRIEPVPMSHSITCYGYAFIEKDRPGKLDRDKAAELGIPEGPMLGRLKAGEPVLLPNGRIIEPVEVLSLPRPGRRILIGGDNDRPERFSPYSGADLLIHEATYTQKDFDRLPRKFKHTTALQLGCAAKKMKMKALAATHFSARYDTAHRMDEIEKEIRECYKGTLYLASDLMQIEL
ncbi:ribonuclease Z [Nitratifractor salsuginis]|uniref:Ribonuclease Z n=1 Tax=Nitratifractor salsuginis (strain DSM 16511 / JCM 12458 / E9I37-1) TaxID=749222 RepID=E6WXY9_NITSE|nr:ribonuclease Z [Nitratifractor salsuginis]ADV46363.1 ribonuclease Z [Nitratifractor salsuginis DSM 16511]